MKTTIPGEKIGSSMHQDRVQTVDISVVHARQ